MASKIFIVVNPSLEEEGCHRICAASFAVSSEGIKLLGTFEEVSPAPLREMFLNVDISHRFTEWVQGQGKPVIWVTPNKMSDFDPILRLLPKWRGKLKQEIVRDRLISQFYLSEQFEDIRGHFLFDELSPMAQTIRLGYLHMLFRPRSPLKGIRWDVWSGYQLMDNNKLPPLCPEGMPVSVHPQLRGDRNVWHVTNEHGLRWYLGDKGWCPLNHPEPSGQG